METWVAKKVMMVTRIHERRKFPRETEPGADSHRTSTRFERNGNILERRGRTDKLAREPPRSRQVQRTLIRRLRQVLHPEVPGFRPMLTAWLGQLQQH